MTPVACPHSRVAQPQSVFCHRENLSVRGASWWMRFIFLNICLFILLFFLTTPAIIVNTIDMFNVTRPVESLKVPSSHRLYRSGPGACPKFPYLEVIHPLASLRRGGCAPCCTSLGRGARPPVSKHRWYLHKWGSSGPCQPPESLAETLGPCLSG